MYSYSRGDQVNEVNLGGTNDVPIYVGKIESGLRFGQNTSGGNAMSYDVYTAEQDPSIEIDNKDKIKVNIYNGDKYDEKYVSNLIKYSSGRSAALLREGNQNDLNNENLTGDQNQLYIDTTGADENATIYFRADNTDTNFLNALTKDFAIRINKHAGQTIVFNITADANTSGSNNLRISKIGVAIDSNDIKYENSYVKSDSQQDDAHNLEIDEMINRKIIWNVTSAREVELNTTAGTFLLPNADEVNITSTSAGWIVAKGTVWNKGCEFHYIYHDRHYPNLYSSKGSVSFGATKKLLKNNDEQSLTAKEFEFGVFDSANNQIASAFNDASGNISFTINYTQADCPKGENRTVNYLVKEIAGNDSLLNYDSSEYRVRVHLSDDTKGHITAVPYLVTTGENNNEQETQITGNGQITFTNTVKSTPAPEETKIDVTVSKVWDDNNNQDGIRPASVTVQLYANGEPEGQPVTLGADGWTHTWTGLTEKKNGTAIEYTVKETAVKDYTSEVTGNATTGYTITNKHTPETTSVSGKKTWIDNNDQDGKRPDKITIRLLANGSEVANKEVTKDGGWKYTFENLPVYENGEKIVYTIKEDAVKDYTSVISDYDVTNTHTPGKTSVTVSKRWEDNNNQDGIRPDSVMVQLYADGDKSGEAVTLNKDNRWTYTWTGLAENGTAIAYTVKETAVKGYTGVVTGNATTGFTITNKHTPETTSVSGTKTWIDNNDQDGKRPDKITIRLLANGSEVDRKEVTKGDGWKYTFENLPVYENGEKINYTIKEDAVQDYTSAVSGYDVTNTHTPGKTSVTVSKVWNDNNNQDGIRPDSVTVQLYANDEKSGKEVTLNKDNNWAYTWKELAEKKNGTAIAYTVKETAVKGYTGVVTGNATEPRPGSITTTRTASVRIRSRFVCLQMAVKLVAKK